MINLGKYNKIKLILRSKNLAIIISFVLFFIPFLSGFYGLPYISIQKPLSVVASPISPFYGVYNSINEDVGMRLREEDILRFILRFSEDLTRPQATKLAKTIIEECDQYDLDPFLILAVIQIESNFSPKAVSNKGARGLMQVTPSTAGYLAEKLGISIRGNRSLHDPFLNVRLGIYYLSLLQDRFKNIEHALLAYNVGPGKFEEYKDQGILASSYSKRVLKFKKLLNNERLIFENG